jgi:hypothetical protein
MLLFWSKNRERFVAKVVVFGEDREPMIKSPATRVVKLASLPKIDPKQEEDRETRTTRTTSTNVCEARRRRCREEEELLILYDKDGN